MFIVGAFVVAQPAYAAKKEATFDCFSETIATSICLDPKEELGTKSAQNNLFSYTLDRVASKSPDTSKKSSKVASSEKKTGLNALLLFNLVNEYRKKIKLPELKANENLCKIAESRLPELQEEIYGWKGMHKGFYERPISQTGAENLISFTTEEEALNWWLNSYIHLQAIQGDYQYSCVACIGNNCTQIFTNTPPKRYSS